MGFVAGPLASVGFLVRIFTAVGLIVGFLVGKAILNLEGIRDGVRNGDTEGFLDGIRNGDAEGVFVGLTVGLLLLGDKVDFFTGVDVGEDMIGAFVGLRNGSNEGAFDGSVDGILTNTGLDDGREIGFTVFR